MPEKMEDNSLDTIKKGFEAMTKLEIVIAPWLVMKENIDRLEDKLRVKLQKSAHELSHTYGKGQISWWASVSVTPEFCYQAYYEVLLSTAAYLSYIRLGTLIITEEMLAVSDSLLKNYLQDGGGVALLSVYTRVMTYLNGQLLKYYGRVPEEIFVSGTWHRPWIDYSLQRELQFGLESEFCRRVEENGEVFIELTEAGERLYQSCREDLERCGYLQQREQLMRASNFTNMDDYEKIMEHGIPEIHNLRKSVIAWSGIQPGMRVLELGCGAGALTLDDGFMNWLGATEP